MLDNGYGWFASEWDMQLAKHDGISFTRLELNRKQYRMYSYFDGVVEHYATFV